MWAEDQEPVRRNALTSARRAVELDPSDSSARWVMGTVLQHERRYDEAGAHLEASIRMNPNDSDALVFMSDFQYMTGNVKEGLEFVAMALRVNPRPPGWYYWHLGYLQVANGQYEDAVATLRREETYRTISRRTLAGALVLLGRMDEAKEEARFFQAANPNWRISTWAPNQPFRNPPDVQLWVNAYRLAGLPE